MKMSEIKIPEISIPEIKIDIPLHTPYQVLNVPPPSIKLPGCVKYHRDASPKNTALYDDDPTGTTISCPSGSMPTFEPMLYDRRKIEIVENKEQEKRVENNEVPKPKEVKPEIPKEKKEIKVVPCPGPKDQRINDFRNSSRLERVIGHEKSEDGTRCITIYEDVPFKDQYIPSLSVVVSTALIASVAATTPLILNVIKPLVKNIIKKLTKKKDKSNP
jgi:hypothetical protein